MDNNTILELLRDSTHVNFDDADRIRVPALVRGAPGIVEYRGMPWLRGMFAPQPKQEIINHRVDTLAKHMV